MVFKFGKRIFISERHFFIELERAYTNEALMQRKPFDLFARDFCRSCGLSVSKAIDLGIKIAAKNPDFYEQATVFRDKIFEKIAVRNVRRIEEKKKLRGKAKTVKFRKRPPK